MKKISLAICYLPNWHLPARPEVGAGSVVTRDVAALAPVGGVSPRVTQYRRAA